MKQSPACKTGMRGQTPEAALLASSNTSDLCTTLAYASEKWSRAKILREQCGRPPNRSKSARWRSQQQRAFAACILHSIRIYENLACVRTVSIDLIISQTVNTDRKLA